MPCVTPAIFVAFVVFTGSEQESPWLYWLERKFIIFAFFVKTPLSWQGTKARFTKGTVFWTPILASASQNRLLSFVPTLEPHNPHTTPTKAMLNIASAIRGVVYILLVS